ncbi:hypothetical protein O7B34_04790 [Mesorhizobium sp. Cs1299R1N3]
MSGGGDHCRFERRLALCGGATIAFEIALWKASRKASKDGST